MTSDSQPPIVLIVDDDTTNIAILAHVLESEFDVVFACDGVDAIERALSLQPSVILLDVMMPGMDGYEVLARLKADPLTAAIPVIFLTGLDASEAETRGLELGAADYVTKPFNAAVVCARVRNQVELKATRDRLHQMAAVDGLTGIANRRTFDETLEREIVRLKRAGGSLTLIVLDVDAFKAYNDTYGHVAGDECLRTIARALAGALPRATDLVARYGGEEFACILPDMQVETAVTIAERLRIAIGNLDIPHRTSGVKPFVTASLGVAVLAARRDATGEALIRAADGFLYAAKAAGRDRAVTGAVD